jgi:hypothetical protein
MGFMNIFWEMGYVTIRCRGVTIPKLVIMMGEIAARTLVIILVGPGWQIPMERADKRGMPVAIPRVTSVNPPWLGCMKIFATRKKKRRMGQ